MSHLPNWQEYGLKATQDAKKDATDIHDETYGKYQEPVEAVPSEERFATAQMPKAPDPSPFQVGPMTSGGR